MVDGVGPPPDMRQAIEMAKGVKDTPARINVLCGINDTVNVGATLSLQGKGLINFEGRTKWRADARPPSCSKMAKALGFIPNEIYAALKKINDAGAVTQSSIDSIAGSGGLGRPAPMAGGGDLPPMG